MIRPFDPELVLTDDEAFAFDPAFDVSGFLLRAGSVLSRATWPTPSELDEISTSALIKRAITQPFPHPSMGPHQVQPPFCSIQLILASLQREQSLIGLSPAAATALRVVPRVVTVQVAPGAPETKTILTNCLWYKFDWALGYGALDRPGKAAPYPPKWNWFRGFVNQIRAAARRYAEFREEFRTGSPMVDLDAKEEGRPALIFPKNAATWALYRYTPRVSSAKLTYDLFARYGWILPA